MKKVFIVSLILSLFVFSCEDNNIDTSEGVKLKCIMFRGFGSSGEFLWFDGGSIVKPSLSDVGMDGGDYNFNGWDKSYNCDEITLFQSEGYFNYILSSNPDVKIFTFFL